MKKHLWKKIFAALKRAAKTFLKALAFGFMKAARALGGLSAKLGR